MSSPIDAAKAAIAVAYAAKEDTDDLILAHRYRLSLLSAPRQSSFRVVALVFYELRSGDDGGSSGSACGPAPVPLPPLPAHPTLGSDRDGDRRHYVVGTNDEPCHIGGSICAERAALVQLRFLPQLERISKVVIVTDSAVAISPGMLCREFMASHPAMDWDGVPIVLGASVCACCGADISAAACSDGEGGMVAATSTTLDGKCSRAGVKVEVTQDDDRQQQLVSRHDFRRTRTTLRELYPHPSPYVSRTAEESAEIGKAYALHQASTMLIGKGKGTEGLSLTAHKAVSLMEAYAAVKVRQVTRQKSQGGYIPNSETSDNQSPSNDTLEGQNQIHKMGSFDSHGEETPEKKAGGDEVPSIQRDDTASEAVVDSPNNTSIECAETSASASASRTVADSSPSRSSIRNAEGTPSPSRAKRKSAKFSQNDRDVMLQCGGEEYRILSRKKAAQHLLNMAVVASSEDSKTELHPIRYGAAVLFSDGTTASTHQKKALEYGCTLDAVGQLAHVIEEKCRLGSNDDDGMPEHPHENGTGTSSTPASSVRPVLIVQSDQFGILHAPFAPARAYLSEHGYGDCDVAVHRGGVWDDPPTNRGIDMLLVQVKALAPSAPNIWGTMP